MTPIDRFERHLPAALADLADPRTPDYFTDILGLTARTRQRPAWASIERLLPMDVTSQRVPMVGIPWRQLGIFAILALLVAGALTVYVGSQPRVPAPFGPAANGSMAFAQDGDILAVEPETGVVTTLIGGPDEDSAPTYSLDGTQVAFLRAVDTSTSHVMVASAAGDGIKAITPEPLSAVTDVVFSPSGEEVVIAARRDLYPALALASTDASAFRWLDTGTQVDRPSFAPPDGRTVMFVETSYGTGQSIKAIDLDSGATSFLVTGTRPSTEIIGAPAYSPDGSRIAYSLWDPGIQNARVHVLDLQTRAAPVQIETPAGICCEGDPTWSHDGTKLALIRWYDTRHVVAIVPTDGGIGTEYDIGPLDELGSLAWSPDDRFIAVVPFRPEGGRSGQVMLHLASGRVETSPWSAQSDPAWQRLAE